MLESASRRFACEPGSGDERLFHQLGEALSELALPVGEISPKLVGVQQAIGEEQVSAVLTLQAGFHLLAGPRCQ